MNAPAGFFAIPEAVSDLDRGYRASITVHYPNVDPMTLAVRVELLRQRDQMAAARRVCCDESYPALSEGLRLATSYALDSSPLRTLLFVHYAIDGLLGAARMIERGCRGQRP